MTDRKVHQVEVCQQMMTGLPLLYVPSELKGGRRGYRLVNLAPLSLTGT
jgi:hypothetical protein